LQDSGNYQGKERLAIRPALLIGQRKITGRELFPDRLIMRGVLGEIGQPIGVPVQIPIDLTNGCEQVKSDREEEDEKQTFPAFDCGFALGIRSAPLALREELRQCKLLATIGGDRRRSDR
jgi:hypothetical protein